MFLDRSIKQSRFRTMARVRACTRGRVGVTARCWLRGKHQQELSANGAIFVANMTCCSMRSRWTDNPGVCYHKGECGLSKDDARAAQLYRKACRGGDRSACHNLDVMKN